ISRDPTKGARDGVDGRGPAQVRAGDPGGVAAGDARPAGGDDRHDRSARQDRAPAGLVDRDHARGAVAPGARRVRLAAAAGRPRAAAAPERVEPVPALAAAGGARPGPGRPGRLPPPRRRAEAAADGGDHRHPSVKTGPQRGPRGYDAHKKVKGRKRVLMVDVEGDTLGVRVVPADVQDRDALAALAPDLAAHPSLRLAWMDLGFAAERCGELLARHGIVRELVGTVGRRGFVVEPRRWKVEQTFGCLQRYRRLRVDDEMSNETLRHMTVLASLFMTGMRLERMLQA